MQSYPKVLYGNSEPLYTLSEAEKIIDYRRHKESRKAKQKRLYYIKQKMVGAAMIILSVVMLFFLDGDITAAIIPFVLGIGLIITSERVLTVN